MQKQTRQSSTTIHCVNHFTTGVDHNALYEVSELAVCLITASKVSLLVATSVEAILLTHTSLTFTPGSTLLISYKLYQERFLTHRDLSSAFSPEAQRYSISSLYLCQLYWFLADAPLL